MMFNDFSAMGWFKPLHPLDLKSPLFSLPSPHLKVNAILLVPFAAVLMNNSIWMYTPQQTKAKSLKALPRQPR